MSIQVPTTADTAPTSATGVLSVNPTPTNAQWPSHSPPSSQSVSGHSGYNISAQNPFVFAPTMGPGSGLMAAPPTHTYLQPYHPSNHSLYPSVGHSSQLPATSNNPYPPSTSLPPLPIPQEGDDDSDDLPPVEKVIKRASKPVSKVAGSRHSIPKGKAKAGESSTPSLKRISPAAADEPEPKRAKASRGGRPGRQAGSLGYTKKETMALLQIIEDYLPIGSNEWEKVEVAFSAYCREQSRPIRSARALEAKFKQLYNTTKPTGNPTIPEQVKRACEINDLINGKAGTTELDDDDEIGKSDEEGFKSGDEEIRDDEDLVSEGENKDGSTRQKASKTQYVARRKGQTPGPTNSRSSASRNASRTLLTNISLALDPSTRHSRQSELAEQLSHSNQIFSLNSQLRDANRRVDEANRRADQANRRADELCGQLLEMNRRYHEEKSATSALTKRLTAQDWTHRQWQNSQQSNLHSHKSPSTRSRMSPIRQDIHYADGGLCTLWIGGDEDDNFDLERYIGANDSPGTRRMTYPDPRSMAKDVLPSLSPNSSFDLQAASDCSQEL